MEDPHSTLGKQRLSAAQRKGGTQPAFAWEVGHWQMARLLEKSWLVRVSRHDSTLHANTNITNSTGIETRKQRQRQRLRRALGALSAARNAQLARLSCAAGIYQRTP